MWLCLTLAGALALPSPLVEVETLDGKVRRGELVELTDQAAVVRVDDAEVRCPRSELAAVRATGTPPPLPDPVVRLELTDRSRLLASEYVVNDGTATLTLRDGRSLTLPTSAIRVVRWRPPSPATDAQWTALLAARAGADRIVVQKKADALDHLEGMVGAVSAEAVRFKLGGDWVNVPRTKLAGVVYYQADHPRHPEPLCSVRSIDGSAWQAATMRVDGDMLLLRTSGGLDIELPWQSVSAVDFAAGNVRYLSDLTPLKQQWAGYFDSPESGAALAVRYGPKRDRSLAGGPLRLAVPDAQGNVRQREYAKGLALHSRSELIYQVPEGFTAFRALAGIDHRVGPIGHVVLRIFGDDRVLLDTAVTGQGPPQAIELDVGGCQRLRIIVDFGEDLDIGDHLDLCEARFTR